MEEITETQIKALGIGSKVFAVHIKYVEENITGGRIRVCRVKTFENRAGVIQPVLTAVGESKSELDYKNHKIYYELDSAIEAIKTGS